LLFTYYLWLYYTDSPGSMFSFSFLFFTFIFFFCEEPAQSAANQR